MEPMESIMNIFGKADTSLTVANVTMETATAKTSQEKLQIIFNAAVGVKVGMIANEYCARRYSIQHMLPKGPLRIIGFAMMTATTLGPFAITSRDFLRNLLKIKPTSDMYAAYINASPNDIKGVDFSKLHEQDIKQEKDYRLDMSKVTSEDEKCSNLDKVFKDIFGNEQWWRIELNKNKKS